jgi:hypothetical protein
MNTANYQPLLFKEMETRDYQNGLQKYQIKCFDDPTFAVTFKANEDQDPEVLALENLGYFVVPEQQYID